MPQDSFTDALAQLDPANRALLDLSLRRGMRPEEISDLLGTDPESVIVAREQALEHLASGLGLEGVPEIDDVRARLADLPAESWTGPRAPLPQVEAIMDDEPEPELERAPKPATRKAVQAPKEKKSRLPLLLALLAVAAVVLVVLLASGGDDSSQPSAPASAPSPKPAAAGKAQGGKPSRSAPKPAPTPAGSKITLTGIGSGDAKGTANLLDGGKRLRLDVTGLPAGSYEVWLYNSIIDAKSLTTARGTTVAVDVKLPPNASHYKYIDISREPADGNPNHSGISVMRVPLAKLAG